MRPIDADYLREQIQRRAESSYGLTREVFELMVNVLDVTDTVDAVEVVRCKDCRWWNDGTQMCGITISATPYGHCHDGERKDNEID